MKKKKLMKAIFNSVGYKPNTFNNIKVEKFDEEAFLYWEYYDADYVADYHGKDKNNNDVDINEPISITVESEYFNEDDGSMTLPTNTTVELIAIVTPPNSNETVVWSADTQDVSFNVNSPTTVLLTTHNDDSQVHITASVGNVSFSFELYIVIP